MSFLKNLPQIFALKKAGFLWLALTSFILLTGISANGQASAPRVPNPLNSAQPVLSLEDVFHFKEVSDLQISPDGSQIAFVLASPDMKNDGFDNAVWLIKTKAGSIPYRLIRNAANPRWSPDGQKIAYIAGDSSGHRQIFTISLSDHKRSILTHANQSPGNFSWSPDGSMIAYASFVPDSVNNSLPYEQLKKPAGAKWAAPAKVFSAPHIYSDGSGELNPGHIHLFVVYLYNNKSKQLTTGNFDETNPASWTPDNKFLLFSANRNQNAAFTFYHSSIYKIDVSRGSMRQLSHRVFGAQNPFSSPDGRLIAYTGAGADKEAYEENNLYVMNADGSNEHMLAEKLDRDIFQPRWNAAGSGIFASYDNRGDTKIGLFSLDGKAAVIAEHVDGDEQFSVSKSGNIAFPGGSGDHPANIVIVDRSGATITLFNFNKDLLNKIKPGVYKPLDVHSSLDQHLVGAFLLLPPAYDPVRRYPLILSIHGGPHGDDGKRWSLESQLFSAAGYIVLSVNYRGSTSYGYDFADQIQGNFPGPAYDDLMSAVDGAIGTGSVDSSRLFVLGGSAGGELTAWIVGKTNRFKAAIAQKPIINEISMSLTSDQYVGNAKYFFRQYPWENPMPYWEHSALSLVAHVVTPTMLMVGEEDYRTPKTEAEQFYNALQLRGIPTCLVLVPGASHESFGARPSQLAQEVALSLAWFKKFDVHK